MSTCSFEPCGRPINAKGLCISHRRQQLKGVELTYIPRRGEKRTCSYEGCTKPYKSNGYCNGHNEQERLGKPLTALQVHRSPNADVQEYILANVIIDEESGCWIWQGTINAQGYGAIGIDGVTYRVHRLLYTLLVGPLDTKTVLDHKECISTACCNPDHLRPTNHKLNMAHRVTLNSNNSTGYRNVCFDKNNKQNPYAVKIMKDGACKQYGSFPTAEQANAFAIKKRAELFGEFAGLEELRKVS